MSNMVNRIKYENDAISLLRGSNMAILSTLSKKFDEFPFGSFITYVTDQNRSIFIYASDLAEHTKNILNNSKACVTVFNTNKEGDKQNSSRLSIMGNFQKIDTSEYERCKERFFKFLPESRNYSKTHDFNFYKMNPDKIRWIGGFGEIAWLKDNNWQIGNPDWSEQENSMIEHMNEDHNDVVINCLKGFHDIHDKSCTMIGINFDGYYIKSNQDIYYIPFEKPCLSSKEIRKALVGHANLFKN